MICSEHVEWCGCCLLLLLLLLRSLTTSKSCIHIEGIGCLLLSTHIHLLLCWLLICAKLITHWCGSAKLPSLVILILVVLWLLTVATSHLHLCSKGHLLLPHVLLLLLHLRSHCLERIWLEFRLYSLCCRLSSCAGGCSCLA